MKKLLTLAVLLLVTSFSVFAQEFSTDYKTISYTRLFEMIEEETDSVFRLSNVIVDYDEATDSLFNITNFVNESTKYSRTVPLIIDKAIELNNVQFFPTLTRQGNGFGQQGVLNNIRFNKRISIRESLNVDLRNCEFFDELRVSTSTGDNLEAVWEYFKTKRFLPGMRLGNNKFRGNVWTTYFAQGMEEEFDAEITIDENEFISVPENGTSTSYLSMFGRNIFAMSLSGNTFKNYGPVHFNDIDNATRNISKNNFNDSHFQLNLTGSRGFNNFGFVENTFNKTVELDIENYHPSYSIPFEQFTVPLYSRSGLGNFLASQALVEFYYGGSFSGQQKDSIQSLYVDRGRITNKLSYKDELTMLGMLNTHYKSKYDNEDANAVYIRLKDLETARFKYLYQETPAFRTFFKWKINQFLKFFVDYGTEPAKAIVMSVYVVLLFAAVYLFFPNYWDSHGKNRIKDRFMFFHKYLRLNKGIQDVYMEGQQEEIESSHAFRKVLDEHKDEVPAFFYNAAGPLLKWSTAGTTIYSKLLSRIDFLKGSWKETDPKVRGFKTALTIVIFIIALLYDILIKMLNALMLSINTFTTLGFGEIPIKGLPRYLAIIQGFIGWFMLTIFSVSLISQLLN